MMIGIILQDVAKSVTKIAVRESRAQDLRNEILNSEKWVMVFNVAWNCDFNCIPFLIHSCTSVFFYDRLKAHFETNPRDLGNVIA